MFKKGKKKKAAVKRHWGERSEMMWEKQLCRHQGRWSRSREEVLQVPEQRVFPCSSWRRPWWGRLCPCSPWRSTVEQICPCSPRGAHTGAGSCQDLQTRGERSPCCSRFAGRACDPVGTHAEAACSWRTAPRGRDPCWGSLWRAAAHGKDSRWRSLWRTVSRERDLTLEPGKSVRSLPPEEEGTAETCGELTVTPIPHHPAPLGGRR